MYLISEGKQRLSDGISTFNKAASEKFQSLTDDDKCQLFVNAAQVQVNETLTESQIGKKITDIFSKVRDRTVNKSNFCHFVSFLGFLILIYSTKNFMIHAHPISMTTDYDSLYSNLIPSLPRYQGMQS
jgi:hypothetical protein